MFFIASIVVAIAVISVLSTSINTINNSITVRTNTLAAQIRTDITIINDPCFVNRSIFVKNTGKTILNAKLVDIYVDGNYTQYDAVSILRSPTGVWEPYNESNGWRPQEVVNFSFSYPLPAGTHTLFVRTENGVYDKMLYTNETC